MRETKYSRAWEALFRELEKAPNDRSTLRVNVLLNQLPLSDPQRDRMNDALTKYQNSYIVTDCYRYVAVLGVIYSTPRRAILYLASGYA